MIGWVVQEVHGLANAIAKRHHPLQKLRPPPTTFWAVIHFDLQPRHGHLLGLLSRCPPVLDGIDDAITGLERTPEGDVPLRTVFIHNPTGNIFLVQTQVVVTCLVITPREAAAGDGTDGHRGFTIEAQAFDAGPGCGFWVFFSICAKIASVAAIFFCGLALTTLRSRKPRRFSTSAIVLGEGTCSSP